MNKPSVRIARAYNNVFDDLDDDIISKFMDNLVVTNPLRSTSTRMRNLIPPQKPIFDFRQNNKEFIKEFQKVYDKYIISKSKSTSPQKDLHVAMPFSSDLTPDSYINHYKKICDKKIIKLLKNIKNGDSIGEIIQIYEFMYQRCVDISSDYFETFTSELNKFKWGVMKEYDLKLLKCKYIILIREFSLLYLKNLIINKEDYTPLIILNYAHMKIHNINNLTIKCYDVDKKNFNNQTVVLGFLLYFFERSEWSYEQLSITMYNNSGSLFRLPQPNASESELKKIFEICKKFIENNKFKIPLSKFAKENVDISIV